MRLVAGVGFYLRARRNDFAPSTRNAATSSLLLLARSLPPDIQLRSLKRKHVEAWLSGMDCQPSTIRTRLSHVRNFCRWAIENKYLKADPTLGIKGPRAPVAMPRELPVTDIGRLLSAVPDVRGELIVLLGVVQGMRRAEIAGQLRENLDLSGRLMLVQGKGNTERWLPIAAQTHECLTRYLAEVPGNTGPLVRSSRHPGRGMTPNHIAFLVQTWMREAGIKQHAFDGKSSHALRHTMAGQMLDAGADIRVAQAALGHRSLQSTYVYLKRRQSTSQLAPVMGQQRYGRLCADHEQRRAAGEACPTCPLAVA